MVHGYRFSFAQLSDLSGSRLTISFINFKGDFSNMYYVHTMYLKKVKIEVF